MGIDPNSPDYCLFCYDFDIPGRTINYSLKVSFPAGRYGPSNSRNCLVNYLWDGGVRILKGPDVAKPHTWQYKTADECVGVWNHYYEITGNKKIDDQDEYAVFNNCKEFVHKTTNVEPQ